MIDPATGWFKMAEIKTKRADTIANVIEQTWFNPYPWPTEVVLDRGMEVMAKFNEMIQREYGVTKQLITTQNQQANGIVERNPPNDRQYALYLLSTFYQIGQRRPLVKNSRSSNVYYKSNNT
eukprot:6629932-Ditylum_brightwellii.AAC.1